MNNLQVLVSTINQTDYNLLDKLNLQSDAVIVNQCDIDNVMILNFKNYRIKWINSKERGLSRSRNLAMLNADKEFCIFCDDDVTYEDKYAITIEKAFKELPQADIIAFNIQSINSCISRDRKDICKIRKAPKYKNYCSVRMAFRLSKLRIIKFNDNFGAGSIYESGEEAIMLKEARVKNLTIFEYPANIGITNCETSTWFLGYNEKYLYDKGALIAEIYANLKWLFIVYYAIRYKKISSIPTAYKIYYIIKGIKGYKNLCSYQDFIEKRDNHISK